MKKSSQTNIVKALENVVSSIQRFLPITDVDPVNYRAEAEPKSATIDSMWFMSGLWQVCSAVLSPYSSVAIFGPFYSF